MRTNWAVGAFLILGIAAEVYSLGTHEPRLTNWDYSTTYQVGAYSTRVLVKEDVLLSDDDAAVVSVSPTGRLYIQEKRIPWTIEVLVESDNRGNVVRSLWLNGIKRNIRSTEEEILSELLVRMARDFGVGGVAKMKRLYRTEGIQAALSVIPPIRSDSAKAHLLDSFVRTGSFGTDDAKALIEATRYIARSSALRELLVTFAERMPPGDDLTSVMMESAANVASGGETRDAIISIAKQRGLGPTSAMAMATTIRGIPSSSDKADALVYLSNQLPSDAESIGAYLGAARTISAGKSASRALRSLPLASFDAENYRTLFDVVGQIPSSSDKREVLEHIASQSGFPPSNAPYYLSAAAHIASSSDKRDALNALGGVALRDEDFRLLFLTITGIASSSDKTEALTNALRHYEISPADLEYYLDAADTIASSSDRKGSVLELMEYAKRRGDSHTQSDRLKERTLQTIETIPSARDREECLRVVIETYG